MSPPRCLIAEDEPLLAESLRADLSELWPALQVVAVVGNGPAAIEQALALQPDICFLDIQMPGCTGLEAAQALAEDWPGPAAPGAGAAGPVAPFDRGAVAPTDGGAGPPSGAGSAPFPLIVFVTAFEHYALQAFDAQAVDYLVKPLDRPRLAACVSRLQARLAARVAPAELLQRAVAQLRALLAPVGGRQRHAGGGGGGGGGGGSGSGGGGGGGGIRGGSGEGCGDTALAGDAVGARAEPVATGTAPAAPPARLQVIQAQVGNLVHLVPVDEVLYFESADKYVRVVTAAREHLVRASLRELLPQLDPAAFWQVHRGTVVQARAIATARREESGKVTLTLRGRPETLTTSRLYAHLFKGM